ncbi:MAG: peptide chain release factor N(5)-glutamine methyltransferase [Eubacterium sp.]|nr:peptide chain release factor N(5)-glutamine methyltransferase [Eubacterium sp.]
MDNNKSVKSTKSIGYLRKKYTSMLEVAGIENAQMEVKWLISYVTDIYDVFLHADEELDDIQCMKLKKLVMKRASHYPLQYLIGDTYFMDLRFLCREKVLIPRTDSENVVYCALEHAPEKVISVLDMCTGSGCIGISYYKYRFKDGFDDHVTLVDISEDALDLASDNARLHNADVKIVQSDLFKSLRDKDGKPKRKYEMILCNPPYIKTNDINYLMKDVRDFEPRLALDGSRDGLEFYRKIVKEALDFLKPEGYLIFEIGYDQYMSVFSLMRQAGFKGIKKLKGMDQLDRVVFGHL